VLRKYIPGAPEFLPYTKDLPKDSTSQKVKAKQAGGVSGGEIAGKAQAKSADAVEAKMQDLKV
jgi:hypothetical protein